MVAGHQPITTGEQRGVESGVGRSDGLHTGIGDWRRPPRLPAAKLMDNPDYSSKMEGVVAAGGP